MLILQNKFARFILMLMFANIFCTVYIDANFANKQL